MCSSCVCIEFFAREVEGLYDFNSQKNLEHTASFKLHRAFGDSCEYVYGE